MAKKFLSKAALLGALALEREFVPIDGDNGVLVTQLSAPDFIEMWDKLKADAGEGNDIKNVDLNLSLLACCIVSEDGQRMLTDPSDIESLRRANPKVFKKISAVALRLNGLDGEVAKNSEASQGDFPSGSPQD